MKLVVGLGNPGEEYENTRHNAGRIMVALIEKKIEGVYRSAARKNKNFLQPLFWRAQWCGFCH
jgi:peptidyl-tRNA hydrolase